MYATLVGLNYGFNFIGVIVRVIAWVASVISSIPYTYAQHYNNTMASDFYMSKATLLRYWG